MKLSDLKKLVAQVESTIQAHDGNPDPDVSFYVTRNQRAIDRFVKVDQKDAENFVEFVVDESIPMSDHRIITVPRDSTGADRTRQTRGDYTIPLLIANFYK